MPRPYQNVILTWLCATLITFAAPADGQDEPVTRRVMSPGTQVQINQIETSQFPKVVIFATVLEDSEPVPGLTNKDFRVREDEVDQEPLTVVPQLTPLSVVLTLDTSGSMKKRLADAQSAAKKFLAILAPQDKAQVLRFSREVRTIYPMGVDRSAADTAIDATVARGDTALWDALYASVESLREVSGRKAIILLSDGVDDDGTGKPLSRYTVNDVLGLARHVNVPIYAIGLGTELDELALKKVAHETGALYLNAVEAGELSRLYGNIGKQLAGQYMISYVSNLPADGSEHHVQLKAGEQVGTKSYVSSTGGTSVAVPTKELVISPAKAKLYARLAPDTPDLPKNESVHWKVYEAQSDFDGKRKRIAYSGLGQTIFTLNPGDYKLEVEYGTAGRIIDLHVQPGADPHGTVVLGAGRVKLSARLGPQSPVLPKNESVHWKVYEAQSDFDGKRKRIAYSGLGQTIFTLNQGDYKLEVEYGTAGRMVDLHVGAGEQTQKEVVLGAGRVKLSARLEPQSPVLPKNESVHWKVYEAQSDFDGKRKRIAYSGLGQTIFTLNQGDYKLEVEYGKVSRMVDLNVKEGEQKVLEVQVTGEQ